MYLNIHYTSKTKTKTKTQSTRIYEVYEKKIRNCPHVQEMYHLYHKFALPPNPRKWYDINNDGIILIRLLTNMFCFWQNLLSKCMFVLMEPTKNLFSELVAGWMKVGRVSGRISQYPLFKYYSLGTEAQCGFSFSGDPSWGHGCDSWVFLETNWI